MQVAVVRNLVADLFNESTTPTRFSLKQITARAAAKGLPIPAARIDEVRRHCSARSHMAFATHLKP